MPGSVFTSSRTSFSASRADEVHPAVAAAAQGAVRARAPAPPRSPRRVARQARRQEVARAALVLARRSRSLRAGRPSRSCPAPRRPECPPSPRGRATWRSTSASPPKRHACGHRGRELASGSRTTARPTEEPAARRLHHAREAQVAVQLVRAAHVAAADRVALRAWAGCAAGRASSRTGLFIASAEASTPEPGVRQLQHLQQPLHLAVLAHAPVQREEGHVDVRRRAAPCPAPGPRRCG